MNKYLNTFINSILFPGILQLFFYFGYFPNFRVKFLEREEFFQFFENGVFRYRVLGKQLLYHLDDFLTKFELNRFINSGMIKELPDGGQFYISIFFHNTIYYLLFCFLFWLFLNRSETKEKRNIFLVYAFSITLIGLTQFMIFPYDTLSYLFLIISIWLSHLWLKSTKNRILLYSLICVNLVLATLNRESSAIHLSYFFAVLMFYKNFTIKNFLIALKTILPMLLVFLISYISIHFILFKADTSGLSTYNKNLIIRNFTDPQQWFGLTFGFLLIVFTLKYICYDYSKNDVIKFVLLTSPYIFFIILAGFYFEIRLYAPIFIGAVSLGFVGRKFSPFNS